jgi:hypothetical protein
MPERQVSLGGGREVDVFRRQSLLHQGQNPRRLLNAIQFPFVSTQWRAALLHSKRSTVPRWSRELRRWLWITNAFRELENHFIPALDPEDDAR